MIVYDKFQLRNHIVSFCGEDDITLELRGSHQHYAEELVDGLLKGIKHVAKHGSVFERIPLTQTKKVIPYRPC